MAFSGRQDNISVSMAPSYPGQNDVNTSDGLFPEVLQPQKRDEDPCLGTLSYQYVDYTQITELRLVFVVCYVLTILLSLLGNLLVILTVTRNHHMRTVTNVYILNLAVADFFVALLVMPFKLIEYVAPCSLKVLSQNAMCPVLYYLLPVFVFTSVFTLVAISIER